MLDPLKPPIIEYFDAQSAPVGPCALLSPNSKQLTLGPALSFIRAALVQTKVGKLTIVRIGVSIS